MRKYIRYTDGFKELHRPDKGCWIDVESPSRDDFTYLIDSLRIPREFLEDINDVDERPRTEISGDLMLTILRIPVRAAAGSESVAPFNTVPIGIITGPGLTVSVCYHHTELLPDFIDHSQRKQVSAPTHSDLILRIINSSAYWFLKYLREMNAAISRAEGRLERTIRNGDLMRLMQIQKSIVYFSTSIRGNQTMIGHLKNVFERTGAQPDPDLAEDVEIELTQAADTVDIYSQILAGTTDAFASIISNNVNDIMKRMTSISITLMIPTLIASFYGMNVAVPAGGNPWAFWGIVVVATLLTAMAVIVFRRLRWF